MKPRAPVLVRIPRKRDGSIDHRRLRRVIAAAPEKRQRVAILRKLVETK